MMKRGRYIFLVLFLLVISSFFVAADGGFFLKDAYKNQDLYEPQQKAIIIHDNNKETLIIQASSEGDVSNFAWVIPVPSYPEVNISNSNLFEELHYLTQPDTIEAISPLDMLPVRTMSKGVFEGVTVYEQKTAGIFDVAILSSEDADSLITWLNQNSYYIPEKASEIIDSYIQNKWYFIAMKVNKENNPLLKSFKEVDDRIYDKNSSIEYLSEKILEAIKRNDTTAINSIFSLKVVRERNEEVNIFSEKMFQSLAELHNADEKSFLDSYLDVNIGSYGSSGPGTENAFWYGIEFYHYSNIKSRGVRTYINFYNYDYKNPPTLDELETYLEIPLKDIKGLEQWQISKYLEERVSEKVKKDLLKSLKERRPFNDTLLKKYADKAKNQDNSQVEVFYNQLMKDFHNRGILIKDELKYQIRNAMWALKDDFSQRIPGKENLNILDSVLIKFNSEKIIYPLKITAINKGETEVLLYVFTNFKTKIDGFKTEFADQLSEDKIKTNSYNYYIENMNKEYTTYSPSTNYYLTELLNQKYNYYLTKHRAKFKTQDIKNDIIIDKADNNAVYRMKIFEAGFAGWLFWAIITLLIFYGWVVLLSLVPKAIFNKTIKDKANPFYFSKLKLLVYPIIISILFLFFLVIESFGVSIGDIGRYIFLILIFPPILGIIIFVTIIHLLISLIIRITRKN
jgi:hypothetical protein